VKLECVLTHRQSFFRSQLDKELADHPELRSLDDPSSGSVKDTSVAPSTATETPQPTPSAPPTRIKLVSNSSASNANSNGAGSQINGGGSGMQSDED
jgi:ATP-dependent helicase STH1/SNF2